MIEISKCPICGCNGHFGACPNKCPKEDPSVTLPKNRLDIEIAVEGMLVDYGMKVGTEYAISSRVRADDIVDAVFRMLKGEEVVIMKPWEAFGFGK